MRKKMFGFARIFGTPLCALRFADGGGSGKEDDTGSGEGKGGTGSQTAGAGNGTGDGTGTGEDEKKFTQSDIDDAVEKRLARERKKWEREQQKQQATPQTQTPAQGAGDGTQQQQAQQPAQQLPKDDSAEKIAKANQRLVASEAKAAAIAAGVKPDRVDYVVRLADLSKVDVDEDDGPDTDAIKKAVDKVLKDMPEFKATSDDGKGNSSGFQIGADGSNQGMQRQTQQQTTNSSPTATKRWNKFRQF
ncbi:MAG TPA: hypothetical protein VHO71_04935 [Caproiciproducens sp.]|nr:hypothetical protein [Caproiciproducens sp.]